MEWLIVAGCFVIFGMTLNKHWNYGLQNYIGKKRTLSNDEFENALEEFNTDTNYNFNCVSSEQSKDNPDRVVDIFEDSSKTRHIKRIRSKSTNTTITAFSPEEIYADLPRPKKDFWGDADENIYFESNEKRNNARSNLSRWQKMMEEE